jgi:diaminohydroxyphosphoribosylaminopyrimidine deaminase/5-amino-6-(5-phosphoribosylamino)uracil reductase
MAFSGADKIFMGRALELARGALGDTFPNPAVGAVVVSADGRIAGEGATGVCGGPHAEKQALGRAGAAARGGTLYVTLEPCSHFGRTPPCADAIIAAGIGSVVAAVKDPNPLVCGKGLRRLRASGIAVRTGLLREEAAAVNEDFFWAITKKRPWVTLKLAMTLDGRVADGHGGSKWITSSAARREVQEIRRRHSAVAVGKNTLLRDDPKLTARCRRTYYPARIVFSSDKNIPKDSYFLTHAGEARSIVVISGGKTARIDRAESGCRYPIEFWYTGAAGSAESIAVFLDMAYAEGLTSILVEGGRRLASGFLEYGFVNKVHLFYGNKIFGGGMEGLRFERGLAVDGCLSLDRISHRSFGDDFLITGYAGGCE